MTLDATLRPVAARLITNYGKTITLSRVMAGAYDPNTGSNTLPTSNTSVKAQITGYNALEKATGAVQSGDVKVTIADISPAPTTSDLLIINGLTYQIASVSAQYTGELVGYYELQARCA